MIMSTDNVALFNKVIGVSADHPLASEPDVKKVCEGSVAKISAERDVDAAGIEIASMIRNGQFNGEVCPFQHFANFAA